MGRRRVDLQTAAQLLGISSDAVRKRAKRGNIAYETGADGKLYVWVDAGETTDYPSGDRGPGARDELVEELRDRVRALEEANRENRRIIAALTSRIPEIEAPSETPESPEGASEEPTGAPPPPEQEEPTSRPWWRRMFG